MKTDIGTQVYISFSGWNIHLTVDMESSQRLSGNIPEWTELVYDGAFKFVEKIDFGIRHECTPAPDSLFLKRNMKSLI